MGETALAIARSETSLMRLFRRPISSQGRRLALALFVALCSASFLYAAPHIKVIKIAVTNPSQVARPAENVVLRVADLLKIAPDFKAGSAIVTATDAATVGEDARTIATVELPSQADD